MSNYDVSYNFVFYFENLSEEEAEDKELLADRFADILYEFLSEGGRPFPDNMKVERVEY